MRALLTLIVLTLAGCGGSASAPDLTACAEVGFENNAGVGSPFVYVDNTWHTVPAEQSVYRKWVVRGTNEDADYSPLNPVWFTPSDGTTQPREWWTLWNAADGVHSDTDKRADNTLPIELAARSGAFLNDALNAPICVSKAPVITLDYKIIDAVGDTIRATVGIVMSDSNGEQFTIEQNLARSWRWNVCQDARYMAQFDRCLPTLWYFAPAPVPGPVDVQALVMATPGMTRIRSDSLKVTGVYIGSEIYGAGRVNWVLRGYRISVRR